MLIEFSVENYRSIRERATLSMVAAPIKSRPPKSGLDVDLDVENTIDVSDKLKLLRSAVIYGANASGKSNILTAMAAFRAIINYSAVWQDEDELPVEPFMLTEGFDQKPTIFDVSILIAEVQYRYGFAATKSRVVEEWLYFWPKGRKVVLFEREAQQIRVGSSLSGARAIANKNVPRTNALFLPHASSLNVDTAKIVRCGLLQTIKVLDATDSSACEDYTINQLKENGNYREAIVNLVRELDLSIEDLGVKERDTSKIAALVVPTPYDPISTHNIRNSEGLIVNKTAFYVNGFESDGTVQLIGIAGPIVEALVTGSTLLVDELDARLHPDMTCALFQLFNSRKTNPKNAQLICASHEHALLNRDVIRRDQVYFVEKDRSENSVMYSLAEIKETRNDIDYAEWYRRGRFGAVPIIGNLSAAIFNSVSDSQSSVGESNEI